MTFDEFVSEWAMKSARQTLQRDGQFAFNLLCDVRPDLSEQIRGGTDLDPFYRDENLPAFWEWLRNNWETT